MKKIITSLHALIMFSLLHTHQIQTLEEANPIEQEMTVIHPKQTANVEYHALEEGEAGHSPAKISFKLRDKAQDWWNNKTVSNFSKIFKSDRVIIRDLVQESIDKNTPTPLENEQIKNVIQKMSVKTRTKLFNEITQYEIKSIIKKQMQNPKAQQLSTENIYGEVFKYNKHIFNSIVPEYELAIPVYDGSSKLSLEFELINISKYDPTKTFQENAIALKNDQNLKITITSLTKILQNHFTKKATVSKKPSSKQPSDTTITLSKTTSTNQEPILNANAFENLPVSLPTPTTPLSLTIIAPKSLTLSTQNISPEISKAAQTLHLTGPITLKTIDQAYKNLIKNAHPDKGGSTTVAQALTQARDILHSALEEQSTDVTRRSIKSNQPTLLISQGKAPTVEPITRTISSPKDEENANTTQGLSSQTTSQEENNDLSLNEEEDNDDDRESVFEEPEPKTPEEIFQDLKFMKTYDQGPHFDYELNLYRHLLSDAQITELTGEQSDNDDTQDEDTNEENEPELIDNATENLPKITTEKQTPPTDINQLTNSLINLLNPHYWLDRNNFDDNLEDRRQRTIDRTTKTKDDIEKQMNDLIKDQLTKFEQKYQGYHDIWNPHFIQQTLQALKEDLATQVKKTLTTAYGLFGTRPDLRQDWLSLSSAEQQTLAENIVSQYYVPKIEAIKDEVIFEANYKKEYEEALKAQEQNQQEDLWQQEQTRQIKGIKLAQKFDADLADILKQEQKRRATLINYLHKQIIDIESEKEKILQQISDLQGEKDKHPYWTHYSVHDLIDKQIQHLESQYNQHCDTEYTLTYKIAKLEVPQFDFEAQQERNINYALPNIISSIDQKNFNAVMSGILSDVFEKDWTQLDKQTKSEILDYLKTSPEFKEQATRNYADPQQTQKEQNAVYSRLIREYKIAPQYSTQAHSD